MPEAIQRGLAHVLRDAYAEEARLVLEREPEITLEADRSLVHSLAAHPSKSYHTDIASDIASDVATVHPRGGEMLAAISRGIVQLMRRTAGKGPTKARAHWAGSDAIVVVLQGGCLRAEQTLQEAGMARTVEATRRALQEALESDMCELVEGLSGRRVAEFLSATRRDSDTTAEVFLLAPDEAP